MIDADVLRKMSTLELRELAFRVGLSLEGLEERHSAMLTKLMQNAYIE